MQASDHLPCADELGRPSLRAGVISRRAHRSSTSTIIGHFGHVEISEESATDGPQRLPSLKYPPSRRSRSVEFVSRQSAMNADAQARQLMMRASQGDQGSGKGDTVEEAEAPQSPVPVREPVTCAICETLSAVLEVERGTHCTCCAAVFIPPLTLDAHCRQQSTILCGPPTAWPSRK